MSRRFAAILLVLAAVALAPAGAVARTAVSGWRLGAHTDGVTRVVFDTSGALAVGVRLLADPYRVVLDSDGVDWLSPPAVARPVGVVSGLHYSEDGGGHLVIELRRPAVVKSAFAIRPRDGLGWRFVVDLKDTTRQGFLAAATTGTSRRPPPPPPPPEAAAVASAPEAVADPAPPESAAASIVVMSPLAAATLEPPPEPPPDPAPVAASRPSSSSAPVPEPRPLRGGGPVLSAPMPPPPDPAVGAFPAMAPPPPEAPPLPVTAAAASVPAPQPSRRADGKPVVVIDPGHGGVDPGAIGVSGVYEKTITLAVARQLRAQLERTGRYHVYLTRDRDVFVHLHERVAIARRDGADLFISLHANVESDPQIRGLSIYTLSKTASDTEAQALADKENKADVITGVDLSHESPDVANILIDLAQRETMNRSAVFAGDVVRELRNSTVLLSNTHRFAGFAVLKGPDVPAVLIEAGYLSNADDEHELRQPEFRTRLAHAIAEAVDRFFRQDAKAGPAEVTGMLDGRGRRE